MLLAADLQGELGPVGAGAEVALPNLKAVVTADEADNRAAVRARMLEHETRHDRVLEREEVRGLEVRVDVAGPAQRRGLVGRRGARHGRCSQQRDGEYEQENDRHRWPPLRVGGQKLVRL